MRDGQSWLGMTTQNYLKYYINQGTYSSQPIGTGCSDIITVQNGIGGNYDIFIASCRASSSDLYLEIRNLSDLALLIKYPLKPN